MWMGCGLSSLMYPKGWQHRRLLACFLERNNSPRALKGPVFWDQLPGPERLACITGDGADVVQSPAAEDWPRGPPSWACADLACPAVVSRQGSLGLGSDCQGEQWGWSGAEGGGTCGGRRYGGQGQVASPN